MDRELYYCKAWPHKKFEIKHNEYDICISPIVKGNMEGTIIQYHGILIKEKSVACMEILKKNISKAEASLYLSQFEEELRQILKTGITWEDNVFDKETVKIWYYDEKEEYSKTYKDDSRRWPFIRFAITAINVRLVENGKDETIRKALEQSVIEWTKRIVDS